MEFEEWWEKYKKTMVTYETYPNITKAAWDARQDEIDQLYHTNKVQAEVIAEMNLKIKNFNAYATILEDQIDKLENEIRVRNIEEI